MLNIDDRTLGQLKQIASMTNNAPSAPKVASPFIGKHVLVRTFSAGVHIGTLEAKDETNVLLKDARRIWKWAGSFTLSEVATAGVKKDESRISCTVPFIELTQATEIIPTTEAARKSLDSIGE
jgi:small nuclear ribonucleoprotein (snRNP)-like protein